MLLASVGAGCLGGQTGTPNSGPADQPCVDPAAVAAAHAGAYTLEGSWHGDGATEGAVTLTLRIVPRSASDAPVGACAPVRIGLRSDDGTLDLETDSWLEGTPRSASAQLACDRKGRTDVAVPELVGVITLAEDVVRAELSLPGASARTPLNAIGVRDVEVAP
jgi:hypothetical protein